jgi:hypothetical protein
MRTGLRALEVVLHMRQSAQCAELRLAAAPLRELMTNALATHSSRE